MAHLSLQRAMRYWHATHEDGSVSAEIHVEVQDHAGAWRHAADLPWSTGSHYGAAGGPSRHVWTPSLGTVVHIEAGESYRVVITPMTGEISAQLFIDGRNASLDSFAYAATPALPLKWEGWRRFNGQGCTEVDKFRATGSCVE